MTFAIKVENLGKRYVIGHRKKESYATLRDTIAQGVHNVWQRLRYPSIPAADNCVEDFWALRDVNFEIHPGDRVGIIGRNGAGKSTLLKVLSRITEPTTGRFVTRGRVAALLEVGTGFHPELTGRDNVYLNGAILGMTRADVKRQFDAIVDFSGVEKFLDTPVKRYSSGMYVRLAFAVAAHLDPDILIVDEVLAVGDAEFQKKCLGKMEEVGKDGRTVVFVSHNMGAVRRLCDRGMVIEGGRQSMLGGICSCISAYEQGVPSLRIHQQKSNTIVTFNDIHCNCTDGLLKVKISYTVNEQIDCAIAIKITNSEGIDVCTLLDSDGNHSMHKSPGSYQCAIRSDVSDFLPGIYSITLSASDMRSKRYSYIERASSFSHYTIPKYIDSGYPDRNTIIHKKADWYFDE